MSRKWLLLGVIVAAIIASAVFLLLVDFDTDGLPNYQEWLSLGTNTFLLDSDGDQLLDGNSIILNDSDELCQKLKQDGILFRVHSDETYQFYGEQYFNSSPSSYSLDEANQAKFLSTISEEEYQRLEQQGLLLDNNLDGDSWSNYFENEVTGTPIDVKNDVYSILMTGPERDFKEVDEMFLILEAELPAENIYDLSGEKNNAQDFDIAFNDVAQKANADDTVFIHAGGEGFEDRFKFMAGSHVSYQWFRERTDKLNSGVTVISFDACNSGSAIGFFESSSNSIIVLTACSPDQRVSFGISHEFLKAFSNPKADTNRNGYVSLSEATNYAKNMRTTRNITPMLSDTSNIGPSSYLIEIMVG